MIDHVMINANDFEKAERFYSWLMPRLGYPKKVVPENSKGKAGWMGESGGLWLTESEGSARSDAFDKRRAGLRELAFSLGGREQVDEIARELEANGGSVLEAPHENARGAYQFFFADPEGIKLEIIVRKR